MMVDDKTAIEGACLCNAVRFRVTGPLRAVVGCHCGQCRKQTGHYMPATGTLLKYFDLLEDRGLKWFAASNIAKRGFCGECGSTLFWQANGADRLAIAAGSIDGTTGVNTVAHIFVEDKGDYYQLDEALPQFPQGDSGIPWPE